MKKYLYAVLSKTEVQELVNPLSSVVPELSATKTSLTNLLACGYRWIRSEGDFAIFEREEHGSLPSPEHGTLFLLSNHHPKIYLRREMLIRADSAEQAVRLANQAFKDNWHAQPIDLVSLNPGNP